MFFVWLFQINVTFSCSVQQELVWVLCAVKNMREKVRMGGSWFEPGRCSGGRARNQGQGSSACDPQQPTVAHSDPGWPRLAQGSINVTHWPLSLSFRKCKKCHLIKTSFLMPCLPEMVSFSDEMCLIARYCISFHLSAIFTRWSIFYGFQTCIFMTHNQGGGLVVPDCQIIHSAHHSEPKRKKNTFLPKAFAPK